MTDDQYTEIMRRLERIEEMVAQSALPLGGARRAKPKPPPQYPWFPKADRDLIFECWREHVDDVDFSRLIKAIAPTMQTCPTGDMIQAVQWYSVAPDTTAKTPENFVARIDHWLTIARAESVHERLIALHS